MDFNKLTIKAQEAVAAAQELARRRGNPEITPDHLLLALLDQELFADWRALRAEAELKIDALPTVQGGQQQPNVSAAFSRVLDRADDERRKLEDDYVSTEHLFLAIEPVPRERDRRVDRARCAADSASPRRTPRAAIRRSRSSAATSPRRPRRASSTR